MRQTYHCHIQNSNGINTAAIFILATLPIIQALSKVPIAVAIAGDAPEANSAIDNESRRMKAVISTAPAVIPVRSNG